MAGTLLQEQFFATFAACRKSSVRPATDDEGQPDALVKAGTALKSSLGYSPITDVGLLASVRLLTENSVVLELSRTTELLKRLQKQTRTSFVSPLTVWGPWPT